MVLLLSTALASAGAPVIVPVLHSTFTNPTPALDDRFGGALAALGGARVIIGAPADNTGETNGGAAYLLDIQGMLLTTFTNPTPAVDDQFGFSVAAVANERVVIGAYRKDTGSPDAGEAYLFSTNGALLTTLTNPTLAADERFGYSVAAVGNACVVIGAPGNDTGADAAGAAYLFSTNGMLITMLTNPAPALGDGFGSSVTAMGSDRVLIGAPVADRFGVPDVGIAYLFSTNGTLLATFNHPRAGLFPGASHRFGTSVAAVGSDHVFVGAPFTDIDPTVFFYPYGAAYLFSTNGVLLTSINNPSREQGFFGNSVASLGSDLLLVGAPRNRLSIGSAYLFSTNGTLVSSLTKPANGSGGFVGAAVLAMGNDRVLVGAPLDNAGAQSPGAAYLFDLVPSLTICSTSSQTLTVAWPLHLPDFLLQQNTNGIGTTNWSNTSEPIQNDGTNKYIIVDPTSGQRFHRLIKP